ncbi:MAG: hypothetical protein SGI73_20815 [Chloroflexota bacterium]|nr:hypothetical protein [Chloroflexota bacterium]
MTFDEIKSEIQHMTDQERAALSIYLIEMETPEERAQQLLTAIRAMREGLSTEEADEIAAAMNEEYVDTKDEFAWLDDLPPEKR